MLVYHGTSWESYQAILKEGFNPTQNTWTCSSYYGDEVYVWPINKMVEEFDMQGEELGYMVDRCVSQAMDSARVSAAVQQSQADYTVVLELQVPKDKLEDDLSCEHADNASLFHADDTEYTIKRVFISDWSVWDCPATLAGLIDNNHYLNIDLIPDGLVNAAKAMINSDSMQYCDILDREIRELH